jgi:hypothetical protein
MYEKIKNYFLSLNLIRGSLLINKLHFFLVMLILLLLVLFFVGITYQYSCLLAKMQADFAVLEVASAAQAIELEIAQEVARSFELKLAAKASSTAPPSGYMSNQDVLLLLFLCAML